MFLPLRRAGVCKQNAAKTHANQQERHMHAHVCLPDNSAYCHVQTQPECTSSSEQEWHACTRALTFRLLPQRSLIHPAATEETTDMSSMGAKASATARSAAIPTGNSNLSLRLYSRNPVTVDTPCKQNGGWYV